jgi:hypothetical protein
MLLESITTASTKGGTRLHTVLRYHVRCSFFLLLLPLTLCTLFTMTLSGVLLDLTNLLERLQV